MGSGVNSEVPTTKTLPEESENTGMYSTERGHNIVASKEYILNKEILFHFLQWRMNFIIFLMCGSKLLHFEGD